MPKTVKQKVKFIGSGKARQIYHIGLKSFPQGVWKDVTDSELAHLILPGIRERFEFNPPLTEEVIKKILKPKTKKRKGGK